MSTRGILHFGSVCDVYVFYWLIVLGGRGGLGGQGDYIIEYVCSSGSDVNF